MYDPSTQQTFVIQNDIFTVGAGSLNIWAALNDSTTVPSGKTAESLSVSYNSASGEFRLTSGQTAVWGHGSIWGRNGAETSTAV